MRRAPNVSSSSSERSSAQPITRRENASSTTELPLQPNVGDVRYQKLIQAAQAHLARQIRIHGPIVTGIRCHHDKLPPPQAQQVVFPHEPPYPLVVHHPTPIL